ncbi:DUF302 domain-containing protein [Hyphococcus sp.]|uniref:DUF302 domain-containing protein n=1 Tax=Hyphococcus sp. TaxID=2038636 RepID=UPI003CCC3772
MKTVFIASAALVTLTACSAPSTQESGAYGVSGGAAIERTTSNAGFESTLAQIQSAIDARGFRTFAVIDHAAGAASVDQSLRPTTLIIFGNPQGGTPVMQADQSMGLELPLKILVVENEDGSVSIIRHDMTQVFENYGIEQQAGGPLQKINGALDAIVEEGAAG